MPDLLRIDNLRIQFPGEPMPAADDVSIGVREGSVIGIVGESGSGKSMTLSACLGMVPSPGRVVHGSIEFDGQDLLRLDPDSMRRLRGKELSMVLQDPMTSLHPSLTVGKQLTNVIRDHQDGSDSATRAARAIEALEMVGVPHAKTRLSAYPHQLSGGLRQRVMIAMAIANKPRVLLADEPTTALDVTVQARILRLLRELNEETGITILLVTHNFGVVAGVCDETVVMRHGKVLESGPTDQVFGAPRHRYTRALLDAVPRVDRPRTAQPTSGAEPASVLFRATGLNRTFKSTGLFGARSSISAMRDVSIEVRRGEALGLVGESGAGKTTLARTLVRLEQPSSGQLLFDGHDITHARGRELRSFRRRVQMVFQDPYSSLDPRWTVERIVGEGLLFHQLCVPRAVRGRVEEVLQQVGLTARVIDRLPRQLSGGERQRVAIARAIAVSPEVLVADEPVSALDVSIQAQIVELFAELRQRLDLTLVLVAHDLGLVRSMCDRVAVMREGALREVGDTELVFTQPQDPYTRELLAAAPSPDPAVARRAHLHSGRTLSAVVTAHIKDGQAS
jgi:peptide/nickel transport system ATP-binding protein